MKLGLVGCLLIAACSEALPPAPPHYGGFMTQSQRESACLDMRDHIVDLYAESFLTERDKLSLSTAERQAYRDAYAEELAKKGTFQRFEESCFATLRVEQYECSMSVRSTEGVEVCMHMAR